MQYIQSNKVNYSSATNQITFYNNKIQSQSDLNFITLLNNNLHYNSYYYQGLTQAMSGTTFNIRTFTMSLNANLIVYSIKPAFFCSNFMSIKDTDTITITIKTDLFTRTYSHPLQIHPVNTVDVCDYIVYNGKPLTYVDISAVSTVPLSIVKPKDFSSNQTETGLNNMQVLVY